MATEMEANIHCCASDPNFAVICSFLEQFSTHCGVACPTFRELQDMLEDTQEVSQVLIDMHIKLLRKARKSFTADKWEKALAKFCHTYSQQDGWELERFGYKQARLGVKVKLLKVLLETQFDVNSKFKSEVNKFGAKDLRLEPLGRDQSGLQYWCHFDKSSHVRVYREDVDEETWELVASDRGGLVQLIDSLSNGEGQLELISILNEDSTSQEIEKPITDTGQENNVEDEDDEQIEEVEEEEEIEEEEEEENVEEEEEESQEENGVESNKQKLEADNINSNDKPSVPKPVVKDRAVSETMGFNQPVKTTAALTGVDLTIKSETKTNPAKLSDYYPSASERPYIPERNDLLSQMSARFNESREAEDLSLNPTKKVKLNDDNEDQPMMLVKKDVVVSEAIEEPISHVTGPGSGQDCEQGNTRDVPQFSEAIEEPINYVTGLGNGRDCNQGNVREDPQVTEAIEEPVQYVKGEGYGVECNIDNPHAPSNSVVLEQEEPEFSEVIEEPVQYIIGLGSGVESNVGNPKLHNSSSSSDLELVSNQEEIEFSETIEEPIQYIAGLGSGEECDVGNLKQCDISEPSSSYSASTMGIECSLNNLSLVAHEPNFSDVIEEPVMFVRGPGYGLDCLTGNPEEVEESAEEKSPEKKPKLWSIDTICSSEKLLSESSGSSQKEPESLEGSSKASEDNGPVNCLEDENRSSTKVSNGSNACLKPSSDIKPILENIPMKDKPPDISNIDSLIREDNKESILSISKNENYLNVNDGNTNCILRADKPNDNSILETDQISNTQIFLSKTDLSQDKKESSFEKQTKSSEGVNTSDDISSTNFKSESKLNIGYQSSMEFPLYGQKSMLPVTSESDVKACSEDNSISSVISEEFASGKSSGTECRENSDTSEDRLVIHSSEKERSDCSDIDMERIAQRKTRKSFDSLCRAQFGAVSRSSINSEKSDLITNKMGATSNQQEISSRNDKNKPTDEEVSCKTNKTQSEKIGLGVGKNNEGTDTNIENGSSPLKASNCSVLERITDISPSTKTSQNENEDDPPKQKIDTESENSSATNNPANTDKSDDKLKNVMLTNIIEMCLDNDTNSRDKAKAGLKGQLNAKFNDLFSAKNLLEPTVKIPGESLTNANGNLISTITEKCAENSCTEEKLIVEDKRKTNHSGVKTVEETSDHPVFKEKSPILKDLYSNLASSSDTENKHENGELVKLEEPMEEIALKNPVKAKSRTNSLNIEDETEIPNKIRRTENIAARRLSRRNTRSVSQAEPSLELESEKLNKQIAPEITVKEEFMREEDKNDHEDNVKPQEREKDLETAVKSEKDIEETDNSKEEEDTVYESKKDSKEDEFNDSIQKEVDDIVGRLNYEEEEEEIKDSNKACTSDNQNKGFSLSSFSLEPPPEDGPVLGKPPEFKTVESRKRRNSRKLSRSEDDGGEEEVVEEAGGKKPKLRAKARRSKGTLPPSHPPQQNDSSSEDNQPEESSTLTPVKAKGKPPRARGRPVKRRNVQGVSKIKSTAGKGKNLEKKEQKSDNESFSEKEEPTQAACEKETKKKHPPIKRESENEDKNQIPLKKENKKGKANSKGLSKNVKKSTKVETEEESDNEDKVEAKDPLKTEEDTDGEEKVKSKSVKKGRKPEKDPKTEEDTDSDGGEETKEACKNTKSEANENIKKCDVEEEHKSAEEKEVKPLPKKKGRPKKRKTLLGLMESDLIHSKPSRDDDGSRVMRQSRRIAQIKIKEQAERRAIEEATIMSLHEIKKKTKEEKPSSAKKQKNKRPKIEKESEEEDASFKEPADDKKKGKRKKKKKGLTYDINKPWQSSSDSSSEEAEEEEEHFEEEDYEEDVRARKVVSDHEFSPESDLEQEETDSVKPIRRARTAKKADEEVEESKEAEVSEDYPCKKCGQPDHPEWILLCDKCDSGYHASCLRPTIMLIPEGDWFCPPCQHAELVSKLKETLRAFERNTKRRENEELRKKRLAYVGISLANVLPTQEKQAPSGRRVQSESSESFSSESETSDEDEEPVYQLRQRRAALQANYRFNDYDDLINSAIQDEMEAVKGAGNMGRGKDIANIVEAEKKEINEDGEEVVNEQEEKVVEEEEEGENWRPPVVPKNTSLPSLRKKSKKLTDLDKHSDDDADSDEDFKGSSGDEEYSSSEGGDSDDSIGRRQPVRRSSRARTSRIDKEFINDDSDSSDEPRKKKTRKVWASSSSESSDWGRRKRKAAKTYSRIKTSRSGKQKKKKSYFDSDSDKPKKPKTKRPKIRFGLSEDDDEPIRRTRGKKMSYLEVAGSDTEEEVLARSRKMLYEEEEEFVPEKEEVEADEEEVEEPEEEVENEDDDDETEIRKRPIDTEHETAKKETLLAEKADQPKELNAPVPESGNNLSTETQKKPVIDDDEDDDEDEDDDLVEEEEIEEEVEEEVEEEEEEELDEDPMEAKNLVREKVRADEPTEIVQPPVKIGSGIPVTKMAVPAVAVPVEAVPKSGSAVAIKEEKKEEKEERKEPTPAIRLVPSAKLLDPTKRRPPDDGVIRGMLAGSGYYRAQPMQAPGRQPFRQRYPEQQRYLYPPVAGHQYYPGGAFYQPGEDLSVSGGYEGQMEGAGDEEGVFSGLVSYFSSQREDNLDS